MTHAGGLSSRSTLQIGFSFLLHFQRAAAITTCVRPAVRSRRLSAEKCVVDDLLDAADDGQVHDKVHQRAEGTAIAAAAAEDDDDHINATVFCSAYEAAADGRQVHNTPLRLRPCSGPSYAFSSSLLLRCRCQPPPCPCSALRMRWGWLKCSLLRPSSPAWCYCLS